MYTKCSTYINDKDMIPLLLTYGWLVFGNTWTDCSQHVYDHIKEVHLHDYKHAKKSWFADNHLSLA